MATPLDDYLEALADLLPGKEARRVLPEVRAMILDRAEAERATDPEIDDAEAERRALTSWDPPELVAEELSAASLRVDLSTRRAFWRSLFALFAGHLALAIVLTAAGPGGVAIPGFLGPLPTAPWTATILGVLSILCIDAGFLLLLFVAIGRSRAKLRLPHLDLRTSWTRREGIQGLVLIALLAMVFNLFLDSIFAIRSGNKLEPFLASDVTALLPMLNAVLGLFAVRHLLVVLGRSDRVETSAADALASLGGAGLAILAATRTDLVSFTSESLTPEATDVLEDVTERVFLLVLVVAALLLAVRFVKRALRTFRLMAR